MIVVETMFFDSDDYDVNTEVIPCDSKETAKAVVKKVYDKLVSRYSFRNEAERKEWEKENVKFKEDGSIYVSGGADMEVSTSLRKSLLRQTQSLVLNQLLAAFINF